MRILLAVITTLTLLAGTAHDRASGSAPAAPRPAAAVERSERLGGAIWPHEDADHAADPARPIATSEEPPAAHRVGSIGEPPPHGTALRGEDEAPQAPAEDRAPRNEPLTIQLSATPATAGLPVALRIHAEDPDAIVTTNCGSWYFADPYATDPQIGGACMITREAERPAAPEPGTLDLDVEHTFAEPGEYQVVVHLMSGDGAGIANPFASSAEAALTIIVGPAHVEAAEPAKAEA